MPLTVVISQSQSKHPAHRSLAEGLARQLEDAGWAEVFVVPHLYDLKPGGPIAKVLEKLSGDLVVCAWLFPRSIHWVLDSLGVRGRFAQASWAEEEAGEMPDGLSESGQVQRVNDWRDIPSREILCLDLRSHTEPGPYWEEVRRLAGTATASSHPASWQQLEEDVRRRWYPVIDYSRCTNCMECIDFCLFGVYGIDGEDTILVEQADNCRKGCPACSRVCPENAIIFPQHKTPAIAGALSTVADVKIDLSQLFGAPDTGEGAKRVAARERDEQLLIAGRKPIGPDQAIPVAHEATKDELDELIDELDRMEL